MVLGQEGDAKGFFFQAELGFDKEAFEMDRAIRGTTKATNTRNAAIAKAVEEFGAGAIGVTSNGNIVSTLPKAEVVLP